MAQAVDEAVVHGVVHDVGHAEGMALLLDGGNVCLGVLGYDSLSGIALDGLLSVEHDAATGVLLRKAASAADGLHAAIGAGSGDVVLQEYALATYGADECVVHTHVVGDVGGWGERYEVVKTVATMYVQQLAHGAYAVCGVGVALMLPTEVGHPALLSTDVGAVAQVVDVGSLQVGEGAEEALLLHGEHGLVEGVVAAVLEHEAVAAGALGGVDELPALGYGGGGGHLNGYVLALLHGIAGHGGVGEPVGADVYQINVGALTQPAPAIGGVVDGGVVASILLHEVVGIGQVRRVDVAQGYDVDMLDGEVATQGGHATIAKADEAYADYGEWLVGQL